MKKGDSAWLKKNGFYHKIYTNWSQSKVDLKKKKKKKIVGLQKTKNYHLDVVGFAAIKKRGSGIVDLNGGWKFSFQVLTVA